MFEIIVKRPLLNTEYLYLFYVLEVKATFKSFSALLFKTYFRRIFVQKLFASPGNLPCFITTGQMLFFVFLT